MYQKQMNAIAECLELVAENYEGHEQAVLNVIADCQEALEEEREGAVGPWEQRELDYARVAVRDGCLRLALGAAEKALVVSQLPRAEYEYGLNYGRTELQRKRDMNWSEKDTLDLLLMIAGAVLGAVIALCVLHYVFLPFSWAAFAVPVCAVIGGYSLRWAVWHHGLRERF